MRGQPTIVGLACPNQRTLYFSASLTALRLSCRKLWFPMLKKLFSATVPFCLMLKGKGKHREIGLKYNHVKSKNPIRSDTWKVASQLDECQTVMATNDDETLSFSNIIRADTFRAGLILIALKKRSVHKISRTKRSGSHLQISLSFNWLSMRLRKRLQWHWSQWCCRSWWKCWSWRCSWKG